LLELIGTPAAGYRGASLAACPPPRRERAPLRAGPRAAAAGPAAPVPAHRWARAAPPAEPAAPLPGRGGAVAGRQGAAAGAAAGRRGAVAGSTTAHRGDGDRNGFCGYYFVQFVLLSNSLYVLRL
jgi:hypothetical protein